MYESGTGHLYHGGNLTQLQSKPNPWFYLPCHVSWISIKSGTFSLITKNGKF